MESFELAILSNVAWATVLALLALATARIFPQRPGLVHGLWVLVLVRLVTPPLVLFSPPAFSESFAPAGVSADRSTERFSDNAVVAPEPSPIATSSLPATPRTTSPLTLPAIATTVAPLEGMPTTTHVGTIEAHSQQAKLDLSRTETTIEVSGVRPRDALWTWRSVAAGLWLVGAIAWGTAVVLQIVRLRVLLRSARPAPGDLQDMTNRLATRLGLRRLPDVWMVPARVPPMLWALGGPPRLLLPADLWDRLDGPQQETILVHELAHLRRRDHWVRWLEGVVLGLYWWNPLAWWARRQIEKAEEPCCDAWVVWALPESVDAYAEALVATAAFLSGPRVPRPLGATGARRVTELRRRLTMILSDAAVGPIARAPRSASTWAMPFCLLALILLPVLAPGQAPESTEREVPASEASGTSPARRAGGDQPPPADPAKDIPSDPSTSEAPLKPVDPSAQAKPATPATSATPSTGGFSMGRANPNAIPGEGLAPGPEMKVQPVVVREIADSLDFTGRFETLERVELRARASGALLKVNAAAGTLVRRGDVVFEIDSRIYVAELHKAEAELARLEAQLRRRLLDFDRAQKLAKASAISQEEVDRKQGDVDEAKAALGAAQPDVELARLKLEATRITAPIDGRFRLERIGVGELILEDKTVLGTIESVDPAAVRFKIDERRFLSMSRPSGGRRLLESGTEVQIGLSDDQGYATRGKLESVDTRINPDTGTVECRALVPNKDGVLLPGMLARVRMEIAPPTRRICVPAAALVRRELVSNHETYVHFFVRVVNDRDLIERREVVLGQALADGHVVVSSSDLKEGERIAVPPAAPVTGQQY